MVEAKIAKWLEGSDKRKNHRNRNLVTKEERFGKIIDTVVTHPDDLIFADKIGCNLSMKNDISMAGTKFITKKRTDPW